MKPLVETAWIRLYRSRTGHASHWMIGLLCGCVIRRPVTSAPGHPYSHRSIVQPPLRCRCQAQASHCSNWQPPVGIGTANCEAST